MGSCLDTDIDPTKKGKGKTVSSDCLKPSKTHISLPSLQPIDP